jgi:malonate transporter and related proteins
MQEILSLSLPFFGLILLGYIMGKIKKIPEQGLEWMQFFIIYVSLPALFFKLISETPFEQLANWRYILTTTLCTYIAFSLSFALGMVMTRGSISVSTLQGMAGSYSNIGYMGPGLTLAALGLGATVPTALIFVFDNALLFVLLPLFMALGGREHGSPGKVALRVLVRIVTHPFNLATMAGILAAATGWRPPQAIDTMLSFLKNAAAPCALFFMGVTVALRPLGKVPLDVPVFVLMKLVVHPALVYFALTWMGGFSEVWVYTAVLMAALPPALGVFVMATQYSLWVNRASSAVLLGTLLSTVTVTVLLYLMRNGYLPV